MTTQIFIPAKDGFYVCIPIEPQAGGPITEFYRDPIIAWMIESSANRTTNPAISADAVTITGVVDDPVIQKPDGTFEVPFMEIFSDENEVLEHMNEMRQF